MSDEELMCYSYALGYNAGYNIGCYDDILERIDEEYMDYFNKGYQRGISDYCITLGPFGKCIW